MYRNTYVKIDVDKLENNVSGLIKAYNEYEWYFGVVKANCYGHGTGCIEYLKKAGINYLAVSSLDEAVKIRKICDLPILCLQPIDAKFANVCATNNVTMTIVNIEYYEELREVVKKEKLHVKVHIKIDSGMSRLGFADKDEVNYVYESILKNSQEGITLEGIYTHFATSGVRDIYWDKQKKQFEEITSRIDLKKIPIVHLAKSATIVNHEKIEYANGVRLGIIMYGYVDKYSLPKGIVGRLRSMKMKYVLKKNKVSKTSTVCLAGLEQVLELVSRVVQVKKISAGAHVGYGATEEMKKDEYVAIVEIGYADGLLLSNNGGYCEINNKRYRIIGLVNMCMIELLVDEKVKCGDEVIVIGKSISTKEVANRTHSTTYFTLTNISPCLPRVYVKKGEILKIDE